VSRHDITYFHIQGAAEEERAGNSQASRLSRKKIMPRSFGPGGFATKKKKGTHFTFTTTRIEGKGGPLAQIFSPTSRPQKKGRKERYGCDSVPVQHRAVVHIAAGVPRGVKSVELGPTASTH